jgi:ankyrin repeat protein
VTEGLKNPKLIPLLVNHNWELGEGESSVFKMLQAARTGKVDRVRTLLKEVKVDAVGDQGETALYLAARKHLVVAQVLIEHGADPNLLSHFSGQV